ncbi:MAG: hypothetical protein R3C14_02140 [Caldilineaceae bacterium]
MMETSEEQPEKTEWHRLFALEQDLALTPVGVGVETEFPAMTDPPKVDLLLLRQRGERWTEAQQARLPDGVRESTAAYNLLEFKYTESLTLDIFWQALGYEHFFRTSRRLAQTTVRLFILSAKTPHAARLAELGFVKTEQPGVMQGDNIKAIIFMCAMSHC